MRISIVLYKSDTLDLVSDGLFTRVISHVNLLVLGHYLIVVLPLSVPDVLVGQNLICQVVVVDYFDHDSPEHHRYSQPLHELQVVTIPQHVHHHSDALPCVYHQGQNVLSEYVHQLIAKYAS